MEQRGDGQRQAGIAVLLLVYRDAQGRAVEIEPGLGLGQAWKQRGEMPVGSHAEQHDVKRSRHRIDRPFRRGHSGARPRRRAVERMELGGTGRTAQQGVAHQMLVAVAVGGAHPAFVGQADMHLGPVQRHRGQAVENRFRRRSARHHKAGGAARGNAVVEQLDDLVGRLVRPARTVGTVGPTDLGANRWFLKHRLHAKSGRHARSAQWRRLAPKNRRCRALPVHSVATRIPGSNQSSATPPRPRPPA